MRRFIRAAAVALALAACGKSGKDAEEAAAPPDSILDVQQEAQRVRVGMTEAEVVGILGQPRSRVRQPMGDRLTFWTFDAQQRIKARVYVTLDPQGKVADVETIPL